MEWKKKRGGGIEKRSNLAEHILINEKKVNLSLGTHTLPYRARCGFLGGSGFTGRFLGNRVLLEWELQNHGPVAKIWGRALLT